MKKILFFIVALFASINMAFAAVNINTASQSELESLQGVGPAKARAIVEDRTKHGPFKSVDDLERVKGFGKKTVDKLRKDLTVNGASSASAPAAKAAPAMPAAPARK